MMPARSYSPFRLIRNYFLSSKDAWFAVSLVLLVASSDLAMPWLVKEAVDIFYDGKQELLLTAPFVRGVKTHGTGCTYSAAITAQMARGFSLPQAVASAKQFVTQAIASSRSVSRALKELPPSAARMRAS